MFPHFADKTSTCSNGEVRLIGGPSIYNGTVELCLEGVWGSICHGGWDVNEANIVCKQLGFSSAGNTALYAAFHGQSSGPIFINNVNCAGTESYLIDCPVGLSVTGCSHYQDSAVSCNPKCKSINITVKCTVHVTVEPRLSVL